MFKLISSRTFMTHKAFLIVVTLLSMLVLGTAFRSSMADRFQTGSVTEVISQESVVVGGQTLYTQQIRVVTKTMDSLVLPVGTTFQPLRPEQRLAVGQVVILTTDDDHQWMVMDIYRWPVLFLLLIVFVSAVLAITRWYGLNSLVALLATMAVIVGWFVPGILAGGSPIVLGFVACTIIGAISLYIGHGWSWKSHLSVVAIIATLAVVSILVTLVVESAQLVGLGSQESFLLQFGPLANIPLQGVLLAAIMLGTLGILDDIVISQISLVFQLKAAQPKLTRSQLFKRALSVGRDHIASLVNTLILAYTGSNLPLFLLIFSQDRSPWWVTLSNETIAEEVVRTLTGSLGLILAVPLATVLACLVVERKKLSDLLPADEL